MKNILYIVIAIIAVIFIASCGSSKSISSNNKLQINNTADTLTKAEYELIVFDPGFEYWFNTRGFSKNQYSNEFLISKNRQYVNEWNRRYTRGDRRMGSYIEYDSLNDYGLDFNYKLFMYFKYFEEINRTKLIP